jgi:hypothetical protein
MAEVRPAMPKLGEETHKKRTLVVRRVVNASCKRCCSNYCFYLVFMSSHSNSNQGSPGGRGR